MKTKLTIFIFLQIFLLSGCSSHASFTFKTGKSEFETRYDDSYFLLDNSQYHEEIALISHANAASSSKNGTDYENRADYLIDLYKKEGLENIYINDAFLVKPTETSVGYGIGNKKIRNTDNTYFNLIAVTIRSAGYEAEWCSNVTIGGTGNAKGFDLSSDEVKEGIYQYLKNYHISGPTKFWISGYSRGGIIANMTAGKLLEDINNNAIPTYIESNKKDVYAYCFEPPNGVYMDQEIASGELYQGIHNLINMNDCVPMLCPTEWGMTRYGNTYYYPDRLTDIYFNESERKKLVSNYHFTPGGHNFKDYTIDDWDFFDPGEELASQGNLPRETIFPSMGIFFQRLVDSFVEALQTRETYSTFLETGLIEFFKAIFGLNKDISDKMIDTNKLTDLVSYYSFARSLINEILQDNVSGAAFDFQLIFYQIFGYNKDNSDAVKQLAAYNFPMFALIGLAFKNSKDLALQFFNRDNFLGITLGHTINLGYTFTKSCDSRYYGNDACKLNDGRYQIIKLSSPTSFTLYENNLKKNVFEYKNNQMESDTLCVEKFANGDISIYIPNNGKYTYDGEFTSLDLYESSYIGVETLVEENLPKVGNIN